MNPRASTDTARASLPPLRGGRPLRRVLLAVLIVALGPGATDLYAAAAEEVARATGSRHAAAVAPPAVPAPPVVSGWRGVVRGPLRAGAGRAPLLSGWTAAVPMATYGPFPPLARGVRDAVYARALVVEVEARRVAIVSCDLLIADAELRRLVLRRLGERGIAVDDLLLAATHTHTSVGGYIDHPAFEAYMLGKFSPGMRSHLVERCVDAVASAVDSLVDAAMRTARGFVSDASRNRRIGVAIDPELSVLRLETGSGRPIATVVSFAAHPTLAPHDRRISGDWPGRLAARLDATGGMGLFLSGALGDLSSRAPDPPLRHARRHESDAVATRLHHATEDALRRASPPRREVELASTTIDVELPPADIPLIPDLLWPLDRLGAWLLEWPRSHPLQAIRIGDVALLATASELGCRLGRRIRRRVGSPFPVVVCHANGYAGYAVSAVCHPLRRTDPVTLVAVHGASHGERIVEAATALAAEQWGESPERLAPGTLEGVLRESGHLSATGLAKRLLAADRRERLECLVDADSTLPLTRRPGAAIGSSVQDRLRLDVEGAIRQGARAGQGLRDDGWQVSSRLRARLPGDLRFDLRSGWRSSEWSSPTASGQLEGWIDPRVGLERPLVLVADRTAGLGVRATPRLELDVPAGDHDPSFPLALAPGTGTWRIGGGAALELVHDTARVVSVEALARSSLDCADGRHPGDRLRSALRYDERFGRVSLGLALDADVLFADDRAGGLRPVDVPRTSFSLSLRPALVVHASRQVDLRLEGVVPLARGGDAGGAGSGWLVGTSISF